MFPDVADLADVALEELWWDAVVGDRPRDEIGEYRRGSGGVDHQLIQVTDESVITCARSDTDVTDESVITCYQVTRTLGMSRS